MGSYSEDKDAFGLGPEAILRINKAFEKIPSIQRAWVFGSRARSKHRKDSDLDFAVFLSPDDGKVLADWIINAREWREQIQNQADLNVDLDLQLASQEHGEIVWAAIENEGVLIVER